MFFWRGNLFDGPDLELSDITGIWEKTAFCPFPVKHCLHSDGDLEGHSYVFILLCDMGSLVIARKNTVVSKGWLMGS